MTTTAPLAHDPTPTTHQGPMGQWFCRFVEQEQSEGDDDDDDFDEYYDERPPQKASKTEYAGTTLQLEPDQTYRLVGPDDYMASWGTWAADASGLTLTEAEDCTNGYEQLEYAWVRDDELTVAFRLIPDAHDGLDVIVLKFGREPEPAKAVGEGVVGTVLAADDDDEVLEALDELLDEEEADPAQLARELWGAVMDGRLAQDPESEEYEMHVTALTDERLTESGGFTIEHAIGWMTAVEVDEHRDLRDAVLDMLAAMPEDPREAELAPLMTDGCIKHLVSSRFLGGGLPESFYQRPCVPQPRVDEASRAYLARTYTTRFEAIERLFVPGHSGEAAVALRYRGSAMLGTSMAFIHARGLQEAVLTIALETLEDESNVRRYELWQNACVLAVMLSVELGRAVPDSVTDALEVEYQGMVLGSLSAEGKATIRTAIAGLPEPQRTVITARLYLDR